MNDMVALVPNAGWDPRILVCRCEGLGDTLTSLIADSFTLGDGVAGVYTDLDTGITYSGFFHEPGRDL